VFAHQRLQLVAVFVVFLLSAAAGGPPNSPARPQRAAFTFATVQRFAQERAARPYRMTSQSIPASPSTPMRAPLQTEAALPVYVQPRDALTRLQRLVSTAP